MGVDLSDIISGVIISIMAAVVVVQANKIKDNEYSKPTQSIVIVSDSCDALALKRFLSQTLSSN